MTVSLSGPAGAEYDLAVDGLAASADPGSDDVIRIRAACREQATETVTVTVTRTAGEGPFTVTARYAG